MKLRRALSFSALVLSLGTLALTACGDDDQVVVVQEDSGAADVVRREGGGITFDDSGPDEVPQGACQPQTPPARTFTPAPRFQNKCTLATIDSLIKSCLVDGASEAACRTATDATSDPCFDCLFNVAGARPNAAHVQFDAREPYLPSLGTCVTAVANESDPNGCAVAVGELDMCTKLACITPCRERSVEERIQCEIAARDSVCFSPASRKVFSDECQKKFDDGSYGGCFDDNISQEDYIRLIMRSACGPNPDGGTTNPPVDAGSDADADADTGP